MENIEEKINSLLRYRDALPEDEQELFDKLVGDAKGRVAACAKAGQLTLLESMLLAMVIAQQKEIESMLCS